MMAPSPKYYVVPLISESGSFSGYQVASDKISSLAKFPFGISDGAEARHQAERLAKLLNASSAK